MKTSPFVSALFTTLLAATAFASGKGPAKLPAFSLPDLEGKSRSGAEFAGKVVVVDFWATWCATCNETVPKLAELQKKFGDKGVAIIGVSVDKGSDRKVSRSAQKWGINYLVLRDEENRMSETFGFKGIPSVYVFGRDGSLVLALPGYDPDQEDQLDAAVASALAAKPSDKPASPVLSGGSKGGGK